VAIQDTKWNGMVGSTETSPCQHLTRNPAEVISKKVIVDQNGVDSGPNLAAQCSLFRFVNILTRRYNNDSWGTFIPF